MIFLPKNVLSDEAFGISLTQSSVRAVKINSAREVIETAEFSLEANTFTPDVINREKLAAVIQSVLNQFKKKTLFAAVSVPDYYSFSRTHNMGKVPLHEISEALSWQVEQVLPLPKESVYYDWKVIDQTEKGTEISLVAMPRMFLDELIEVFESVNCNPLTFEPSTSNLTRLLHKIQEPHIIAELNAQGSSITFIQKGISHVTVTNQYTSNTPQEVTLALEKTVKSIQSLMMYCSQKDPELVNNLLIKISGESTSDEIKNWLQTMLKREVQILNVPNVAPHLHQAYASALGLIRREDSNRIINLLPNTLRELYSVNKTYQKTISGFQIAALFQFVSLGISVVALMLALNAVRTSNVELQQVESSSGSFNYNAQEIVKINQRSQSVVSLFPQKSSQVDVLEDLFSVTEEGITVSYFNFDRKTNQIEVSGTAATRQALTQYKEALEALESITGVRVPLEALEKPENISFTILVYIVKP